MEHKNHDKVFFINFGIVLAALGGFFFVCVIAASILAPDPQPDAQAMERLQSRIDLPGEVVTDPAALMKVSTQAAREPYTAEQVLGRACNACHATGVLEAPKMGDKAAWSGRAAAAGGLDGLTASAIKGKNAMPARGGDPDLKDEEVRSAVEAMLKQSGV